MSVAERNRLAAVRRNSSGNSRSISAMHALAQRGRAVLEVPGGDLAEAVAQQPLFTRAAFSRPLRSGRRLAETDARGRLDELRDAAGREEHVGLERAAEEHVVVRVEEVLGEPLDVVQLALDRMRVVGRQHARCRRTSPRSARSSPRVVGEPSGRGRVGGDEDAPHPRREHVHRAERVLAARRSAGSGPRSRHPRPRRSSACAWRARAGTRSLEPSTQENTMSMSKLTSLASGVHMFWIVCHSRPKRCTVSPTASCRGIVARMRAFCSGALDLVLAELPQLELHRRLAPVPQPADGLDARPVEPQDGVPSGARPGGRRPASTGRRMRLLRRRSPRRRTARPRTRSASAAASAFRRARSTAMIGRSSSSRTSRYSMPAASSASPIAQQVLDHRLVRASCGRRRARTGPCARRRRPDRTSRAVRRRARAPAPGRWTPADRWRRRRMRARTPERRRGADRGCGRSRGVWLLSVGYLPW